MTPCWSRLQGPHTKRWGLVVGYAGILLQMCGLLLESIADLKKSGFKPQYRHAWCNAVGVWKWSSHPNYLGEGMLW
jgi:steroid 5-alpha reductase family enzyme